MKRFILALIIISLVSCILYANFSYSEVESGSGGTVVLPDAVLGKIYKRLNKIYSRVKKQGKNSEKLDQILANQEEIKKELAIIKVRVTR